MKYGKIVKRLLSTVLISTMVITAMTGCGNTDKDNNKEDVNVQDDSQSDDNQTDDNQTDDNQTDEAEFDAKAICEGVKLTIAINSDPQVEDYNTNLMTKMVEEDLGVDLEFMTIPDGEYWDKLNVMVQSGEKLPDMIFCTTGTAPSKFDGWVKEGVLVELSDYYASDDYAKNIRAYIDEVGFDWTTYLRNTDGDIYGLPMYDHIIDETWKKIWVYEPWLKAVGIDKVPETTEEFYEACKAVVAADPNGNGKPDEFAFTGTAPKPGNVSGGWFDVLMSGYIYAGDSEWRVLKDGTISAAYATDEWQEGLKYIKKFFDDGLIGKDVFTNNWDQWWAQQWSEEINSFAFSWFYYDGADFEAGDGYTYITALEGPNGEKNPYIEESLPKMGAVITADCENPEAAFLVGDYLCSDEIAIGMKHGERGVDWDFWEEANIEDKSIYEPHISGYDMTFVKYDTNFYYDGEVQNVSYWIRGPWLNRRALAFGQAMDKSALKEEAPNKAKIEAKYLESYQAVLNGGPYERLGYLPLTIEESEKIAEMKTNLKNYLAEATAKFLIGEMDLDDDWDAYIAELEKIGYETIIETYQKSYDRLYK